MITKLELGGAQVNTVYTHNHLDECKFEAFLISGPGGILDDKVERKKNFLIVPDLIREIRPLKDLRAFLQTMKILRRIKPHILHTHSTKAGIIGRVAAFLLSVPQRIHSVHGFAFSPLQSIVKRNIYYLAELLVSRLTSHFVFVAKADVRIAKKKRLVKNNYSLIRSGFPLAKFQHKDADINGLKKRFNIREDQVVCGVIAPFKAQKGLFHLIETAKRVIKMDKRALFFLAGDGELRLHIEAELKKRGIFDYFRLPGFLFDIHRVMDIFDIGVTTALWEGLPQSLVQMRLKKIPVVASDIPGNREVIQQDKNGWLVEVTDYDTFADKILCLIENRQERLKLASYSESYSHWDADFMVRKQEKMYQLLLNLS